MKRHANASSSTLFDFTPVFSLRLVRERDYATPPLDGPASAAKLLAAYLDGLDREHVAAVFLATNGRPIGISTISIGTLTSALISPREVFKTALLVNAAAVVIGHNHPSGNPEPSRADIAVTRTLVEAGRLLDIPVHDHIIVTHDGGFTSLAERGHL